MKNVNSANNTVTDQLSRQFEYLRISVTDRCNFRCSYCMPSDIFNKDYKYIPHDRILSYEEIIDICKLLKKVGLKKVRITGGEPLLRKNIDKLIYKLKTEVKIDYISITTNGSLLSKEKIYQLKSSGLDSITLSLDTLNQSRIKKINGTKININLAQTLGNIEKYFGSVKTNTVVIKGVNDDEIKDIVELMKKYKSEVRFIEYMDVGESNDWNYNKVIPSKDLIEMLSMEYDLEERLTEASSTATKFRISNSKVNLGFISSITKPFCSQCNRARLSVDGLIYTCLFANQGFDIKNIIRSDNHEKVFLDHFNKVWSQRNDQYSQIRFSKKNKLPKVEMSYIGG